MKRTLLTLTMVLASSVYSQTFGFDLLDRMLGMKGCGSSVSCCDTGSHLSSCEPACGCEVACDPCGNAGGGPGCGLEAACGCAEPACGCEAPCDPCGGAGPACGCEAVGCDTGSCGTGSCGKRGGLLSKLFSRHKQSSCDAGCEPACGCEAPCDPCGAAGPACGCEAAGCDSGCCSKPRNRGLLSKLFGNLHRKSNGCDIGCDSAGCGCGVSHSNGDYPSAAPMPPAPVVDPSASVSSKRRVIQASAVYVR